MRAQNRNLEVRLLVERTAHGAALKAGWVSGTLPISRHASLEMCQPGHSHVLAEVIVVVAGLSGTLSFFFSCYRCHASSLGLPNGAAARVNGWAVATDITMRVCVRVCVCMSAMREECRWKCVFTSFESLFCVPPVSSLSLTINVSRDVIVPFSPAVDVGRAYQPILE